MFKLYTGGDFKMDGSSQVPGGGTPGGSDPNAPMGGGVPGVDPNTPVGGIQIPPAAPQNPVNPVADPSVPAQGDGNVGGDSGNGGQQPPVGGTSV